MEKKHEHQHEDHKPHADILQKVEVDVENLSPNIHCDVRTIVDRHEGAIKIKIILKFFN